MSLLPSQVILAGTSPVFRRMFEQPGTREATAGAAVLGDTSLEAIRLMLRIVYTGKMELPPPDTPNTRSRKRKAAPEIGEEGFRDELLVS